MHVIIPAAGFGTRLGELTIDTPKGLLLVNEKPVLDYIFQKIEGLQKTVDITAVYIVTNNKFCGSFKSWLLGYRQKNYSNEELSRQLCERIEILSDGTNSNDDRLGQVGDIYFALNKEKKVDDDVLLLTSDNLFTFDLSEVYKFAMNKKCITNVIYDVKDKESAKKSGVVLLNKEDLIKEFEEKPNEPKSSLASTGISVFPKSMLYVIRQYHNEYTEKEKQNLDKMGYLFTRLVNDGVKVYGFRCKDEDKWLDIGTPECLKVAEELFR